MATLFYEHGLADTTEGIGNNAEVEGEGEVETETAETLAQKRTETVQALLFKVHTAFVAQVS